MLIKILRFLSVFSLCRCFLSNNDASVIGDSRLFGCELCFHLPRCFVKSGKGFQSLKHDYVVFEPESER
jgi:hypothetical protein